jgi:creatinine amidohydrolase
MSKRGFQKLVLYNTHGGNTALIDVMARDLRAEFGLRTFALHGSGGISFEGLDPQERAYGFHAGEVETRFCWRACRSWWTAPRTPSTTSRTFPSRKCCCRKTLPPPFAWLTRDIAPAA